MSSWFQALSKLAFFIILLPAALTFLQLQYAEQRANLLFVGPASLPSEQDAVKTSEMTQNMLGMYQGLSNGGKQTVFSKVKGLTKWHLRWPSIAHSSTTLATPTSTLLRDSLSSDEDTAAMMYYETNKWCLQSGSNKLCSHPTDDALAPCSGIWTDEGGGQSIRVSYKGPIETDKAADSSNLDPREKKFRRNPNKRSRQNRNLEQVLLRPATTLLLALNIMLALIYWNRGTNPADVAKIYSKIVVDGELWRSFTGATAHFEPLHLGFNMMALYSLGGELEASYGSIPFLLYNVALIPITTVIMMTIVYLQIKWTGDAALAETSTVGYSGVLFAWMVISSLERTSTCPIPFFPSVCFSTHHIGGFKFNIGPVVQLFVAQLIMKRVSFVGHLAGIIAGFALHWNLLPLELVQPFVIVPAIQLAYLWTASHILPVTRIGVDENESGDEESNNMTENAPELTPSGRFDSRRIKRERDRAMHQLLVRIRSALVVIVVLGAFTFDPLGGILLCPILNLVFYHFCIQSHSLLLAVSRDTTLCNNEKDRLGTLWKGFIMSSILMISCDSMSIAAWIVSSVYWETAGGFSVGLIPACSLLLVRLGVQVTALALACKNLSDIGKTGGGVFVVVFGSTVLENARTVGSALYTSITRRDFTAFEGRGVTLGVVNGF